MQYHLCRRTGRLVEFSEQYLLDCGFGLFNNLLAGCLGGSARGAAE